MTFNQEILESYLRKDPLTQSVLASSDSTSSSSREELQGLTDEVIAAAEILMSLRHAYDRIPVDFSPHPSNPETTGREQNQSSPVRVPITPRAAKKRRMSDEVDAGRSRSPKRPKKISPAAEQGKAWCRAIKTMDENELPSFFPPKDVFDALDGSPETITKEIKLTKPGRITIPGAFPIKECEMNGPYNPSSAVRASVDNDHPTLSIKEQRFVAAFNGRLSEEVYQDCKKRIFACARWRTEEDGLYHNTESSQQCCRMNVNLVSIIHEWFNGMGMFNKPWQLNNKTKRPEYLGHLTRDTSGRNGRPTRGDGKACENVPISTEQLCQGSGSPAQY